MSGYPAGFVPSRDAAGSIDIRKTAVFSISGYSAGILFSRDAAGSIDIRKTAICSISGYCAGILFSRDAAGSQTQALNPAAAQIAKQSHIIRSTPLDCEIADGMVHAIKRASERMAAVTADRHESRCAVPAAGRTRIDIPREHIAASQIVLHILQLNYIAHQAVVVVRLSITKESLNRPAQCCGRVRLIRSLSIRRIADMHAAVRFDADVRTAQYGCPIRCFDVRRIQQPYVAALQDYASCLQAAHVDDISRCAFRGQSSQWICSGRRKACSVYFIKRACRGREAADIDLSRRAEQDAVRIDEIDCTCTLDDSIDFGARTALDQIQIVLPIKSNGASFANGEALPVHDIVLRCSGYRLRIAGCTDADSRRIGSAASHGQCNCRLWIIYSFHGQHGQDTERPCCECGCDLQPQHAPAAAFSLCLSF